jgi:hypothetical protein
LPNLTSIPPSSQGAAAAEAPLEVTPEVPPEVTPEVPLEITLKALIEVLPPISTIDWERIKTFRRKL